MAYFRELGERLDVPYQSLINYGLGHLADNRWTVPDLERDAADKTSREGSAA